VTTGLLERGPIQVELSQLLHDASVGRGRIVFLGGEAGVGKTSLVQRFAQLVEDRARVLIGACDPLSTPRPLGPVLDMKDLLGARFSDLLVREERRGPLFDGFLEELSRGDVPALVVFEDVHWADEATLDLLRFVARRIEDAPALLIATYRDDEVGGRHPLRVVLGDLATAPALRRLSVEPLSVEAVRTLAAGTALDPVRLHDRTGGNPFFVTEVIAAGETGIPASVRDAVLARAARLPGGARDVLDAAAVLGFRIEPDLLDSVAAPADVSLDRCLESGLLLEHGEHIAFRHELGRQAILDAIAPRRVRQLHRAALAALRQRSDEAADAGRLAHHAEAAGDAEVVLEFAPVAAHRAAALSAHREAAAHYARALRFADRHRRADLLERYAEEVRIGDDHEEALRAAGELLAICREAGDRRKEGWCQNFLAMCLISLGRNAEAERSSRAAIELLESLPAGRELGMAYAGQAGLRMLNRDNAEAVTWAERALAIAVPEGDIETQIASYNRLGSAKMMAGDQEGQRILERSLEMAREMEAHRHVALAFTNLGSGAGELYRFPQASRYLSEGIEYAARHEVEGNRCYMQAWYAVVLLHLGRWRESEEMAMEVLARPRAAAISRITALVALGRLKARRGDPELESVLDEALSLALPTATLQRLAPVRAARAEAAWLAGEEETARAEAGAALELAVDHRHPWLAGELLFRLARGGEPEHAPDWIASPFALQIERRWAEAAAEWDRLACPYEAAAALAETTDLDALRRALRTFRKMGARPAARATARRLRALGVRKIPRGPRPSTRDNPAGLTSRQLDVARLLAEGLTNAEIGERLVITTKTVGHHVSAVLAKLDAGSRTEAARKLSELNPQDRDSALPT
jgi:DNA-binding CsgD family transcriptional regulator